ncbi:BamA/TamA family outer membrane protein [bacterium]|nr:BamA/TamA family outer membrane protein [bacterium]
MRIKLIIAFLLFSASLSCQIEYNYQQIKHWFFFPLLAYTEETSLVYGGVVIYDTAKSKENFDGQWSNVIQHSLKNQFRFISKANFSMLEDYSTSFALRTRSWPTTIYEFGNESDKNSETKYTETEYSLELNLYRKLYRYLSLGVNSEIGYLQVSKRDENDYIDWQKTLGNDGGWFNGLGSVLKLDTRNLVNYPSRGVYYRISYRNYSPKWGSDYEFGMTEIDLKNYFSTSPNLILATHLDAKLTHGDVPFQRLAKLGDRLRGFSSRRFMDNHRIAGRVELRTSPFYNGIYTRAGFVLFVETGKVANELAEIDFSDLKLSYGTGFRYKLTNSEDKLNMRFDIAFTQEGYSINISAYEEF